MPYLKIHGANIYYEEHGTAPETIVFSHGFLWSGYMFHGQIVALKNHYRCVTFDFRGQGQSEATPSGYDIESLYADAVALIERLGCSPCHFAGLSMGGFVGLRLAIRRPDLLKTLILIDTSSDPEPKENIRSYRMLSLVVRLMGFRPVANRVMGTMFSQKFLNDPGRAPLKQEWKKRMMANNRVGSLRALSGMMARDGLTDHLDRIKTPTLIIVGDQDVATVPAKAERMHAAIANSKLIVIPGAGHTSTVEEPAAVTAAIHDFITSQTG